MKIAALPAIAKAIYPYWVVSRVAVLLAIGLTLLHLSELSRRVLRKLRFAPQTGLYANSINAMRSANKI